MAGRGAQGVPGGRSWGWPSGGPAGAAEGGGPEGAPPAADRAGGERVGRGRRGPPAPAGVGVGGLAPPGGPPPAPPFLRPVLEIHTHSPTHPPIHTPPHTPRAQARSQTPAVHVPPGPSGKAWSAVSSVPGLAGALVTLSAYPGRYQSCPGRRRGGAGRGGAIGAAANHSEPLAPLPVPVQFPPPPPSPARPPSHLRRPPPSPAPTRPLPPRRHAGPRRGGPQRTPRCRRPRSARDASPAETRAPGRPPPAARRLLRPRDKAGRPVLREPRHAVLFSVPPGRSKGLTLCVARWQVSGEQAPDGSGGGRAATACRKAAQAVRAPARVR